MAFHWSCHNKGKNVELSGGRVTARRVRDGNYGVVITEEALRPGQRIQLRLDETSESWALGLVSCPWWVNFTLVHYAYGNAGFTIIYFHEFRNASKKSLRGLFFSFKTKHAICTAPKCKGNVPCAQDWWSKKIAENCSFGKRLYLAPGFRFCKWIKPIKAQWINGDYEWCLLGLGCKNNWNTAYEQRARSSNHLHDRFGSVLGSKT